MTTQLAAQSKTMSSMQTQIHQLEQTVNESHHIEQGFLYCGQVDDWPVHGHNKFSVVSQQFQRTYERAPVVDLSVSYLYLETRASVTIQLLTVNETSFTARCISPWNGPTHWDNTLQEITLRWTSFPV